ncbi:unnamed protein product [Periconia digitata]|uniref:Uncharacterized protein n=1 Tax=Periconia digitata TaxID=1303443 RepID=A0A9W4UVH4_9PLEO|nr:unnamed protein product [Periconia digitata]
MKNNIQAIIYATSDAPRTLRGSSPVDTDVRPARRLGPKPPTKAPIKPFQEPKKLPRALVKPSLWARHYAQCRSNQPRALHKTLAPRREEELAKAVVFFLSRRVGMVEKLGLGSPD